MRRSTAEDANSAAKSIKSSKRVSSSSTKLAASKSSTRVSTSSTRDSKSPTKRASSTSSTRNSKSPAKRASSKSSTRDSKSPANSRAKSSQAKNGKKKMEVKNEHEYANVSRRDSREVDEKPLLDDIEALLVRERKLFEYELSEKETEMKMLKKQVESLQELVVAKEDTGEKAGNLTEIIDYRDAIAEENHWKLLVNVGVKQGMENSPTSKILDLNISGQNLVAKDIAELVRHVQWMKSLKSINVANNALDDACAVYLGSLLQLKIQGIDISNNNMAEGCVKVICERLPMNKTLLWINTSGNLFCYMPGMGEKLGKAIMKCKLLKHFQTSLADAEQFATESSKPVNNAHAFLDHAFKVVKSKKKEDRKQKPSEIESLGLVGAQLSKRTISQLAMHCKFLSNLDLSFSFLGVRGIQTFVNTWSSENLHSLNLKMCALGNTGCDILATFLKCNISLINLGLSGNEIGDLGIERLANALQDQKVLSRIDLSRNYFQEDGCMALLRIARRNPQFVSFGDISSMLGIPIIHRQALERALKYNATNISRETTILDALYASFCDTTHKIQLTNKFTKVYSLPIVKSGSVFLQWNIIDLDHHLWKWKLTINEAELITQGAGSITNSAGCHFDGGESMELWIQCNEPPKNGAELHIEDIKQFENDGRFTIFKHDEPFVLSELSTSTTHTPVKRLYMYSHHPVRLSWVVTVYDTALSDNAQMEYLAHCSWLITRSISGYGNTTLVHEGTTSQFTHNFHQNALHISYLTPEWCFGDEATIFITPPKDDFHPMLFHRIEMQQLHPSLPLDMKHQLPNLRFISANPFEPTHDVHHEIQVSVPIV